MIQLMCAVGWFILHKSGSLGAPFQDPKIELPGIKPLGIYQDISPYIGLRPEIMVGTSSILQFMQVS